MIKSIILTNFLSYCFQSIDLTPLNVIVGPNSSGKSNFIRALETLHSTSTSLYSFIQRGGGVDAWIHKNLNSSSIEVEIDTLHYKIQLNSIKHFLEIDESVFDEKNVFYCKLKRGEGYLIVNGEQRKCKNTSPVESVFTHRKDPNAYPQLAKISSVFSEMRFYKGWNIPRFPQDICLHDEYLESDASNLALVLNRLRQIPSVKKRILESLYVLYQSIDDFGVQIEERTIQVFLQEKDHVFPSQRLSDGTLRYLTLLCILLNPTPGSIVCIEEPELGLHPDVLPTVAKLIKELSHRTQVFITTHSEIIVDFLKNCPEALITASVDVDGTQLRRLNS